MDKKKQGVGKGTRRKSLELSRGRPDDTEGWGGVEQRYTSRKSIVGSVPRPKRAKQGRRESRGRFSPASRTDEPFEQIYSVYWRQKEAFVMADRLVKNRIEAKGQAPSGWGAITTVSFETGTGGRRKFVTCSLGSLWERMSSLPPAARHFYEIIREDTPCALYLDLEFRRAYNPGVDGDYLVRILLGRVAQLFRELYGLEIRKEDVIDLESSTPKKYSRHVIVHPRSPVTGERVMFRSGRHVGEFVLALAEQLHEEKEAGSHEAKALWVKEEDGEDVFFADLAVYTRNRAMRMFLSSKYGKTAVLMPSEDCMYGLDAKSVPMLVDAAGWDAVGEDGSRGLRRIPKVQSRSSQEEHQLWKDSLICQGFCPMHVISDDKEEVNDVKLLYLWPPLSAPPSSLPPPPNQKIPPNIGDVERMIGTAPKWNPDALNSLRHRATLEYGASLSATARRRGTTGILRRFRRQASKEGLSLSRRRPPPTSRPPSSPSQWTSASPSLLDGTLMIEGHRSTPFPSLDAWLLAYASRHGGPDAEIRSWTAWVKDLAFSVPKSNHQDDDDEDDETESHRASPSLSAQDDEETEVVRIRVATRLRYFLCKNRYCARIGRQHKSNNVVYSVDLERATAFQTCMDFSCRDYRSPIIYVPIEVMPDQVPHGAVLVPAEEEDAALVAVAEAVEEEEMLKKEQEEDRRLLEESTALPASSPMRLRSQTTQLTTPAPATAPRPAPSTSSLRVSAIAALPDARGPIFTVSKQSDPDELRDSVLAKIQLDEDFPQRSVQPTAAAAEEASFPPPPTGFSRTQSQFQSSHIDVKPTRHSPPSVSLSAPEPNHNSDQGLSPPIPSPPRRPLRLSDLLQTPNSLPDDAIAQAIETSPEKWG